MWLWPPFLYKGTRPSPLSPLHSKPPLQRTLQTLSAPSSSPSSKIKMPYPSTTSRVGHNSNDDSSSRATQSVPYAPPHRRGSHGSFPLATAQRGESMDMDASRGPPTQVTNHGAVALTRSATQPRNASRRPSQGHPTAQPIIPASRYLPGAMGWTEDQLPPRPTQPQMNQPQQRPRHVPQAYNNNVGVGPSQATQSRSANPEVALLNSIPGPSGLPSRQPGDMREEDIPGPAQVYVFPPRTFQTRGEEEQFALHVSRNELALRLMEEQEGSRGRGVRRDVTVPGSLARFLVRPTGDDADMHRNLKHRAQSEFPRD